MYDIYDINTILRILPAQAYTDVSVYPLEFSTM